MIRGFPDRPRCEAKHGIVLDEDGAVDGWTFWFNHWPPTDNNKGRFWGGRYVSNPAVVRFEYLLKGAVMEFKVPPLLGWRVLRFHHVFPHERHGDPSNYIKVTQDALQSVGVLANDKYALGQVASVHYPWDPPIPGAGARVIGMTVTIHDAQPIDVGTPRPPKWKPLVGWINPAPARQR